MSNSTPPPRPSGLQHTTPSSGKRENVYAQGEDVHNSVCDALEAIFPPTRLQATTGYPFSSPAPATSEDTSGDTSADSWLLRSELDSALEECKVAFRQCTEDMSPTLSLLSRLSLTASCQDSSQLSTATAQPGNQPGVQYLAFHVAPPVPGLTQGGAGSPLSVEKRRPDGQMVGSDALSYAGAGLVGVLKITHREVGRREGDGKKEEPVSLQGCIVQVDRERETVVDLGFYKSAKLALLTQQVATSSASNSARLVLVECERLPFQPIQESLVGSSPEGHDLIQQCLNGGAIMTLEDALEASSGQERTLPFSTAIEPLCVSCSRGVACILGPNRRILFYDLEEDEEEEEEEDDEEEEEEDEDGE